MDSKFRFLHAWSVADEANQALWMTDIENSESQAGTRFRGEKLLANCFIGYYAESCLPEVLK